MKRLLACSILSASMLLTLSVCSAAEETKAEKTPAKAEAKADRKPEAEKKEGQYPNPSRYEKDIAKFEAKDKTEMPPAGAVLCIGSSSMRGWHPTIKADFAPLTVIPRGFGGSNMNDILHFMDRVVLPYKPRAIVLYEGDNDAAAKVKVEKILETFQTFIKKLHEALPETRVYVLSTKPSISRLKLWPAMVEWNNAVKAECGKNELLTYVDVATPMIGEDGTPKKELFKKDMLHMERAGYEIWTKVVQEKIVEIEKQ